MRYENRIRKNQCFVICPWRLATCRGWPNLYNNLEGIMWLKSKIALWFTNLTNAFTFRWQVQHFLVPCFYYQEEFRSSLYQWRFISTFRWKARRWWKSLASELVASLTKKRNRKEWLKIESFHLKLSMLSKSVTFKKLFNKVKTPFSNTSEIQSVLSAQKKFFLYWLSLFVCLSWRWHLYVQFGVAITAHLLSFCAKDRGVLALHFQAGFPKNSSIIWTLF